MVGQIFDLPYFQQISLTCGYKQHNIALKWFRDSREKMGEDHVVFPNDCAVRVAHNLHLKGTNYSWDETKWHDWTWQEMVAQMDTTSMRLVVHGPDDRSRGIVSCRLEKTEITDHKRNAARRTNPLARSPGEQLMAWDFVVVRDDGGFCRLHPNYSDTRITLGWGAAVADAACPRTGLGGTSGRGTFKAMITRQVDTVIRFDPRKPFAYTQPIFTQANAASSSSGGPAPDATAWQ